MDMKKQQKKNIKISHADEKIRKLFGDRKKLLLGIVVLLFLLGFGYGLTKVYAQMQRSRNDEENKTVETTKQLNSLSEEINQVKKENETLKSATPSVVPTPSPVIITKYVQVPAASPTDDLAARKAAFDKKVQNFVAKARAAGDDNISIMNTIKYEYQLEFGQPLIINQPSQPTTTYPKNCTSLQNGNATYTNCY